MFEENEPGNITPGLYAGAEVPNSAEEHVSPAEAAFHDEEAMKSNPEPGVEMAWPSEHQPIPASVRDYKMVESDPNAPVASDALIGVGEVASKDLIGDAQRAADTVRPTEEEPESAVPYHSMDAVMSDASFNTEVPPVLPEKKDLPTGEDIWSGKNAA